MANWRASLGGIQLKDVGEMVEPFSAVEKWRPSVVVMNNMGLSSTTMAKKSRIFRQEVVLFEIGGLTR
jgi:hypothetical protein